MNLFLVDRLGKYHPGYKVELCKVNYPEPNDVTLFLDNLFPDGLSRHGFEHFINPNANMSRHTVTIEWAAEFYRRSVCPDKPSRMTSIFACGSIEDAKQFRMNFGKLSDSIYEVSVANDEIIHRGDMNLLRNNCNMVHFTYLLNLYWSGQEGDNAFWEYLIPLPAQIGNKVN